jgi:hypothetical protein
MVVQMSSNDTSHCLCLAQKIFIFSHHYKGFLLPQILRLPLYAHNTGTAVYTHIRVRFFPKHDTHL